MAKEDDKKEDAKADETVDLKNSIMDALKGFSARLDSMEAADKARRDSEDEKKKEDKKADETKESAEKKEAAKEEREAEKETKSVTAKGDSKKKDEDLEDCEPERVAADKKRKDEDEDEEKKKDAMKADADELKARMDELEKSMPKERAADDAEKMADAQAKAAEVFQAFGDKEPRPMNGETVPAYRRRVAKQLQAHSTSAKGVNLMAIHDENGFAVIEKLIYADAMAAAEAPANLAPGELRMRSRNQNGHIINEYNGQPSAWMDSLAGPQRQFATEFLQGAN